jgi:hypothetical protein
VFIAHDLFDYAQLQRRNVGTEFNAAKMDAAAKQFDQ